ncbi:MAG: hypothetical protein MZV64_34455 [Ignavibacteriales bacterium]|nr:hypothetical protein [Ignavibacteriales bacterium]
MSGVTGKGTAGKTIKRQAFSRPGPPFPTLRDLPDTVLGRSSIPSSICSTRTTALSARLPWRGSGTRAYVPQCWHRCLALKLLPPRCPSCGLPSFRDSSRRCSSLRANAS